MMGPTVDAETRQPIARHRQLEVDGIVRAGALLQNKDVMMNKSTPILEQPADVPPAMAAAAGGDGGATNIYGAPVSGGRVRVCSCV
jgi:DNA-directed RNA polymerase beta subunit